MPTALRGHADPFGDPVLKFKGMPAPSRGHGTQKLHTGFPHSIALDPSI